MNGAAGWTRLDVLLARRGVFPSRERAKAEILRGVVYVNGKRADKPAALCAEDAVVELRNAPPDYVSRGAFKLEKALDVFEIDPGGLVCLDCGASTGGFTDLLLRRGAARVYAVDVGWGQLEPRLRGDPRVVNMERTNVRYLQAGALPEEPSLAVMDLSFISLRLVLPAVKALLAGDGALVCLVKPQFEAGRAHVGKGGVVRDPAAHTAVLSAFLTYTAELCLQLRGLTHSPAPGPAGNIEYLAYLALSGASVAADAAAVVAAAFKELR